MWIPQSSYTLPLGTPRDVTATLEDTSTVSYKIKHILSIWLHNSTPKHSAKRNDNLYSQKNLYILAPFIIIPNWKQPNKSFSKRMDNETGVSPYQWMLAETNNNNNDDKITMNSQCTQRLGWISKALCWQTETSFRRLQTMGFHSCDILKMTKIIVIQKRSLVARGWEYAHCMTTDSYHGAVLILGVVMLH
jgi:hypothetical protein